MKKRDKLKRCPAGECLEMIPSWSAFCKEHWFALPSDKRDAITAANKGHDRLASVLAVRAAMDCLANKLSRRPTKTPADVMSNLFGGRSLMGSKHSLRTRLMAQQFGKCFWCGLPLRDPTIDHVLPKSRGGFGLNGNKVAACRTCNQRKGARTAEEFVRAELMRILNFLNSEGFKVYGRAKR